MFDSHGQEVCRLYEGILLRDFSFIVQMAEIELINYSRPVSVSSSDALWVGQSINGTQCKQLNKSGIVSKASKAKYDCKIIWNYDIFIEIHHHLQ